VVTRAVLAVVACMGCAQLAGLGDPVGLAPTDAAPLTDTGDTAEDDADAAIRATPLIFYREKTGDVAYLSLRIDGRLETKSTGSAPPGLTSFAALTPERLVGYDARTGARTLASVAPVTPPLAVLGSDSLPGFSGVAALPGGRLLSYRRDDGTLRVDQLVGTTLGKVKERTSDEWRGFETLLVTRGGTMLLYSVADGRAWAGYWRDTDDAPTKISLSPLSPGWTHIARMFESHVFFYDSEDGDRGRAAFTRLTESDTDFLLWDPVGGTKLPIGTESWTHIAGTPRTLLFYRASDAAVRIATIATDEDLRQYFLDLTPTPAPSLGPGWTHIVSLE